MIIPFLKSGSFKSRSGKTADFDEERLKAIVESTRKREYQNNQFPIVIGHPKTDSPAFGWVDKHAVALSDGILTAITNDSDTTDELKDYVKKGLYKTVSVALRDDNSIRHIGFLGGQPPAVAGLPGVSLESDEADLILEFTEFEISIYPFRSAGEKPYIYDKEKTELSESINNNGDEPVGDNKKPADLKAHIEQLKADGNVELAEELERGINSTEEFQTKISELERENLENKALAFCESEEMKNRIAPAIKSEVVAALVRFEQDKTELEFSEGEGSNAKTEKSSPAKTFKKVLGMLPEMNFGETKGNKKNRSLPADNSNEFAELGEVDEERLSLHNEALELMEREGITYDAAIEKLVNNK